jgi:hypothetical protein
MPALGVVFRAEVLVLGLELLVVLVGHINKILDELQFFLVRVDLLFQALVLFAQRVDLPRFGLELVTQLVVCLPQVFLLLVHFDQCLQHFICAFLFTGQLLFQLENPRLLSCAFLHNLVNADCQLGHELFLEFAQPCRLQFLDGVGDEGAFKSLELRVLYGPVGRLT